MDLLTPIVRQFFKPRVRAVKRYDGEFEALQKRTLQMLVRQGAKTDWGRRHHFDQIHSYADFAAGW